MLCLQMTRLKVKGGSSLEGKGRSEPAFAEETNRRDDGAQLARQISSYKAEASAQMQREMPATAVGASASSGLESQPPIRGDILGLFQHDLNQQRSSVADSTVTPALAALQQGLANTNLVRQALLESSRGNQSMDPHNQVLAAALQQLLSLPSNQQHQQQQHQQQQQQQALRQQDDAARIPTFSSLLQMPFSSSNLSQREPNLATNGKSNNPGASMMTSNDASMNSAAANDIIVEHLRRTLLEQQQQQQQSSIGINNASAFPGLISSILQPPATAPSSSAPAPANNANNILQQLLLQQLLQSSTAQQQQPQQPQFPASLVQSLLTKGYTEL